MVFGFKRAIQNRTRYNCGLRHLLKHVLPYSTQTQPSAVQVKVVLYYTWPRARSSLQVEVLFGGAHPAADSTAAAAAAAATAANFMATVGAAADVDSTAGATAGAAVSVDVVVKL